MKLHAIIAAAVLLSSCGSVPADPEQTLERVKAGRTLRVGLVAAGDAAPDPRAAAFVGRVADATGATPQIERGAAEPVLARLERGEIDLAVGTMAKKSPWSTLVTFLPPLADAADGHQLVAMARNGENAWISLLHRHAEAVASQ